MGEGKGGSQVGILGSNKNKQDMCMQPRRLTHRRMIEGNTCTVLWCGSTQEVRRHGQAHLVGAIRSRSPACIFLIRTQIIGRCCCIISHRGVARPCVWASRSVPQRRRTAPARQTVSRYVLCLILVGNTDHIIVIVQSRGQCGLGGGAQLLLHCFLMTVEEDVVCVRCVCDSSY